MSDESLVQKITNPKHPPSQDVMEVIKTSRTPVGVYTGRVLNRQYVPINDFVSKQIDEGMTPANARDLVHYITAKPDFERSLAAFIPDTGFTNGVQPDRFVLYKPKKGGGELTIVDRGVLVGPDRPMLLFRGPPQTKNEQ